MENRKQRFILKKKEEEIERKYLDNFNTKKKIKLQYLSFLVGGIIASISLYYYTSYKHLFSLLIFILIFNGLTSNILKAMVYFTKKQYKNDEKNLGKYNTMKLEVLQYLISLILFIGLCISLYYFIVLNNIFCLLLFILFFNRFANDIKKIIKFIITK